MVFGWGRKKTVEPESEVRSIRLEEAPEISKEAHRRRSEQTITEASNTLHRTNSLIRELGRIRSDIEQDDIRTDDVDKRLIPLVAKGKRMLLDALRNNAVEIKPIRDYEDMVRANEELDHHLKRVGNILGKQTRVIHIFAEKYAARLKQILEEVDENRKSMTKATNRYQYDTELADSVAEGIRNVRALEQSVLDNAGRGRQAEREKADAEQHMQRVSGQIAEFKSSKEYSDLLKLQERMEEGEAARAALASEVSTQFTRVSRPMSRYVHVSSDKEQTALLHRVIKNPYDTMNRRDMDGVITLLEGIRKAVLSRSISVKDTDKASDAITQTEEAIGGFVERAADIEANVRGAAEMIKKSSPTRLDALEKDMESLQDDRRRADQKIVDTANAARLAAASIPAEIGRVQDSLLRITGARYQIEYAPPRS